MRNDFMWIDFLVAGILIFFLFRGDRRGFIASLLGIIGWAVSLIAAFVLYPYTVDYLDSKTGIRESLAVHVTEYVKKKLISQMNGSNGGSLPDSVLAALSGTTNSTIDVQAAAAAKPIVNVFMDIVAFVVVLVLVRLIFKIVQAISMKITGRNHGAIGMLNSAGGMVFGIIEGAIIAYLILLLLDYLALFAGSNILMNQMNDSIVMGLIQQFDLIPYSGNIDSLMN